MPIVAKSVIAARRAAAAGIAANVPKPDVTVAHAPSPLPPTVVTPPPAATRPQQRGHAARGPDDKWQPTGDYAAGWCRPPEATRFKKGGKPGPGRPKGGRQP